MPQHQLTPEDIYTFAKSEFPEYQRAITLSTRLAEDLKLLGDDASEFIERFSEQFNVDLSGFVFSDHFPAEGSAEMLAYLSRVAAPSKHTLIRFMRRFDCALWQLFANKISFKPVMLEHLYLSAKSGSWAYEQSTQLSTRQAK
jgi:hypothetical protein